MPNVTILVAYHARPGQAGAAVEALSALIKIVVAEEHACHGIQLLQDEADPHKILLVEEWTDAATFRGPHMTTPHLTAFRGKAPQWFAGPPETSYWSHTVTARTISKGV